MFSRPGERYSTNRSTQLAHNPCFLECCNCQQDSGFEASQGRDDARFPTELTTIGLGAPPQWMLTELFSGESRNDATGQLGPAGMGVESKLT